MKRHFFSAVKPRKGAKRTIDFKAGLSPNPDRSAPKVRDVIAVFSQSQLHCLGLALFLARAELEKLGFIILDDPVLSSDEDYRVHFNSTVIAELLKVPIQVIVLTQDHDTWEELETRYRHLGISIAQLYIERPAEGSIIENTSDALLLKSTALNPWHVGDILLSERNVASSCVMRESAFPRKCWSRIGRQMEIQMHPSVTSRVKPWNG